MTKNTKEYAFVLDITGNKLAPTNTNKAWILIRKQKAILINKYPMTIQLKREVEINKKAELFCGIDIGSIHTGIAIVQKCETHNKPIFKGTIEHRKDVKSLMDTRKGYRRYKRRHKRYRQARFDNRSKSRRENRVVPSILQKKQSIIRGINRLSKYVNITAYYLEDVAIDIRALTEGKKQCVNGIIHRDMVSYINKKKEVFVGYVTAMYEDKKQMNVQTPKTHLKRCGWKRTKLLWRFNKTYWF